MSLERNFETSETTVGGIAEDMFMNLVSSRLLEPDCEWHTFKADLEINGNSYELRITIKEAVDESA